MSSAGVGTRIDTTLIPRTPCQLLEDACPTVAVIAVLVALAAPRYLWEATSDALLPALMSTQRLTVFYWGQDRLANVVPLLAWPVRDPIWNFRFQMLVDGSAFFGLIAMFAWFHLHLTERRTRGWTLAAATGIAGLLVMLPMRSGAGYAFVFEQAYALSALSFFLGVRLQVNGPAARWRGQRIAGSLLILLAVSLNPSCVLFSPVVLILDDARAGRARRAAVAGLVVGAAYIAVAVASRTWATGPSQRQYYDNFSVSRLIDGLEASSSNVLGSVVLSLAGALALVCVVIVGSRWRLLPMRLRLAYVVSPVFAAFWFLLFTANEWVEINAHEFRYQFPLYATAMLFAAGAAAEITTAVVKRRAARSHPHPTRADWRSAGIVSLVVAGIGLALAVTARTNIDDLASTADELEVIRQENLRLVAGDYWSVWPIVVAGRGEGLDLLGVARRSEPIADEINQEVDAAMSVDGFVLALCADGDVAQCVAELAYFTGRAWSATPVATSRPGVIRLQPTTVDR